MLQSSFSFLYLLHESSQYIYQQSFRLYNYSPGSQGAGPSSASLGCSFFSSSTYFLLQYYPFLITSGYSRFSRIGLIRGVSSSSRNTVFRQQRQQSSFSLVPFSSLESNSSSSSASLDSVQFSYYLLATSSLLLYPPLLIIAKSFLGSSFLRPFLVQGPFFSPFYRAQISFFGPLHFLAQCPGFPQLQQVSSLFFRLLFLFLLSYYFFLISPFSYQAKT